MKFNGNSKRSAVALLLCGLFATAITGCQSTVGGQTLPSAYYLRDDVQFFPTGPKFKLTNELRAHEQYQLDQEAIRDGLGAEGAPAPGAPAPGAPGPAAPGPPTP